MYFALVIVGAMHGLLFLPILLSYFGMYEIFIEFILETFVCKLIFPGPKSLEIYNEEKQTRQVSLTDTGLSSGININDDEGDICDSSRKL